MGEDLDRFGLTEEEQMLQDMVRRLAREKVTSGAGKKETGKVNSRGRC